MWRHPWSNVWALPLFVVPVLLPFISGLYTEKYNAIVTLPTYGQVEGFTVASFYRTTPNIRINHFLGVPFARRPSQFGDPRREFRFQKPERPSWTGIWNATYYRPACPQHPWYMRQYIPNYSNFSEDCLYLNVFAPNDTDERPTEANPSLYPVLVYIHGGGYTVGSGQLYPGTLLAQRRVVVVTFNYRLNALGFLSTGDQNSPGNYGLWDQVAALQFVKENIQYFRGNPNKITLVGHSTGASSVGLHMISPRSGNVGLNSFFDQAILMSGSDLSEWAIVDPVSQAQEYAKELGYLVGCPTGDTVQLVRCLRDSRTADDIVNASIRVRVKKGLVANPWAPVVDGNIVGPDLAVVPDLPRKQRETGQFRKIRVMAGVAQDDGSWFIPNLASLPTGVTENQFENILFEFLQDRGVKDRTVALNALKFQYTYWPLPREDGPRRQMVTDMMSDYMFGSTVNEVLQMHTRNHTFFYNFNYKSYNDYLPPWRGVAHGQELQYLFGFPFFNETYLKLTGIYPRQRYTYGDTNCSEFMMNMFTNFTSYGNPTSSNFYRREFYNTTWMQYNMNNHSTFIIQNMSTSYNRLNFRQTSYAFWRNYYPQLAGFDSLTDNGLELAQEGVTQFKTATWSLTAGSALLLIIIVVLVLGFYCRNKKKSDEFYGTSYA